MRAIRSLATLTVVKLASLFLLVIVGAGYLGGDLLPRFDGEIPSASNIGLAALLLAPARYLFLDIQSGRAMMSFLFAVFGSFIWLAATAVFSRLIVYILTCAAVPTLRKRYADRGGFVLPGGYLLPLLGIAASGWLTLQVGLDSLVLTVLLILIGSTLYAVARHHNSE